MIGHGRKVFTGISAFSRGFTVCFGVTTVSTLSTTSNLAKGVLSKGSTYLSQLADIDAIAFDKTGTLTNGEPKVTNYYFTHSVNEENIIDIIVALEKESNHPLANAILEKFEVKNKIDIEVTNQIGKV